MTSVSSTSVGRIEYSEKLISVVTPRMPWSISRVTLPVRRSRWKRRLSECRWRNDCSDSVCTAACVTLAKKNSRSSVNSEVDSRSSP